MKSLQIMFMLSVTSLFFNLNCLAQTSDQHSPITLKIDYSKMSIKQEIKQIEGAANKIKKNSQDIIAEVERHQLVATAAPVAVGGTVIAATPSPSGVLEIGDKLPPRKKYLEYYLSQITKSNNNINIMIDNLKTKLSPSNDTLTKLYSDVENLQSDINAHYKELNELVVNNDLDNLKVGKQALNIYDDITKLNKNLKEINTIQAKIEKENGR